MKKVFATALMTLTCLTTYGGGGWPQPKNEGFFKLGQNMIRSGYFFNPAGEVIPITTTSLYTTSLYGEYGFTNRLTGIVYFPFYVRGTLNRISYRQSGKQEAGDAVNAIGDTDVGLKYAFLAGKPLFASITVLLGLPLGDTGGGRTGILQTGDGEFNQLVRLDVSGSLGAGVFVSGYLGFNNRTRGFSDEFRYGAEIGFTWKKITPILKINSVHSFFNGNAETVQNGVFSNNTEYFSPTVEVNYQWTKHAGISLSGGFALSGRNILAAPNWSAGVYWKL
jgi:protein XagA